MKKVFIFLLCLSIAVGKLSAQRTISGTVTDSEGEPLPGVAILIDKSDKGTITDFNGAYKLAVHKGNRYLKYNYIGYEQKVLDLLTDTIFDIVLHASEMELSDVVISNSSKTRKMAKKRGLPRERGDGFASSASHKSVSKELVITVIDDSSEESLDISSEDAAFSPVVGINAGTLTAGEVHDFSKWNLWSDLSNTDLEYWKNQWNTYPVNRYTVQLETKEGRAVVGASVSLMRENTVVWTAPTDNTGKAELWSNMFDTLAANSKYSAIVEYAGQSHIINKLKPFKKGVNFLKLNSDCNAPNVVDIAFVVDATGSMQDEINYLKAELNDVISRLKDTLPNHTINLGSVFYRDKGESYLTKVSDLTDSINTTINFIKSNNAAGGGDNPEAVETALDVAINQLSWNKNAVSKIMFLILDAPPHNTPEIKEQIETLITKAARQGIRVVPVACSGITKSTEYLMRTFALATNGTYLFLTDKSGVGGSHIKPTTDKYDEELFNALVLKTIYNFSYVPPCAEKLEITTTDTLLVQHPDYKSKALIDSLANDSSNTSANNVVAIDKDSTVMNKNISWKIYPNPNRGMFKIEIEGSINELFICDLSGKIIQRYSSEGESLLEVDISEFPTGIYLVRYLYDKDKWLTGKVMLIKD